MEENNSNIEKKRGIDRFFWYALVTFQTFFKWRRNKNEEDVGACFSCVDGKPEHDGEQGYVNGKYLKYEE